MAIGTEPGTVTERNVLVPMRDGVELAVDVHRPAVDHPVPALLVLLPYHKDGVAAGATEPDFFVPHGFATVNADLRGTGASGGTTTDGSFCGPEQQADGYDLVEWIAAQEWCTGAVGMTGTSFGWFTTLLTAANQPPSLRAIVPIFGGVDFFQDWNEGGNMLGHLFTGRYSAQMLAMNACPPATHDREGRWAEVWREHLEGNEPWLFPWLEHPNEDEYWQACSVKQYYSAITVPTLLIGAWQDFNPGDPLEVFTHIDAPKRMIMGPWNHGDPRSTIPGPRVDLRPEIARWFLEWLTDESTGIMDEPPVTFFVQEPGFDDIRKNRHGYWRTADAWPPAGSGSETFLLSADGTLQTAGSDVSEGSVAFEYRPTAGMEAGLVGGVTADFGLPRDQRADEAYAATFTSAPLSEPLTVCGKPSVRLRVSAGAPVAAFVVKLCDVAPDGSSSMISRASLNGAYRDSFSEPTPMVPGEVYEVGLDLKATTYVLEAGHSLRVSVDGADFPWLWPTPYPTVNAVHCGEGSSLTIPSVPEEDGDAPLPAAVATPGLERPDVSPGTHYEVRRDLLGGRTSVAWGWLRRRTSTDGADLEFATQSEITSHQDDPAFVIVRGESRYSFLRPESTTTVRSTSVVRSDDSHFHADLNVRVDVDDAEYFSRRWDPLLPPGRALMPFTPVELAAKYYEAWNTRNLELPYEIFGDDFVIHDPTSPIPIRHGPEGVARRIQEYATGFPDLHIDVEQVIDGGADVVSRWILRGTHLGHFRGLDATGSRVAVTGITIHRCADGAIRAAWVNWDGHGLVRQIEGEAAPGWD